MRNFSASLLSDVSRSSFCNLSFSIICSQAEIEAVCDLNLEIGVTDMKRIVAAICGIALTSLITVSGASVGQVKQGKATKAPVLTGGQYTKYASISLDTARKIARTAFPGNIDSEELERERGGSGLRYSFDIRKNGITHEVGVDAVTGKILENSLEGPDSD